MIHHKDGANRNFMVGEVVLRSRQLTVEAVAREPPGFWIGSCSSRPIPRPLRA